MCFLMPVIDVLQALKPAQWQCRQYHKTSVTYIYIMLRLKNASQQLDVGQESMCGFTQGASSVVIRNSTQPESRSTGEDGRKFNSALMFDEA
ncbi:unnamed protein product [Sphagnum balticum]